MKPGEGRPARGGQKGTGMTNIRKLLAALLLIPAVSAASDAYVPPALEEWKDWVLHGQEWRECPMRHDGSSALSNNRYCAWPGTLSLDVDEDGARFTQTWTVYAEPQEVPLPGSARHWPDLVQVDGSPALVLSDNETPWLELPPGQHVVSGRFRWEARPSVLRAPPGIGLVALRVNGRTIDNPEIDGSRLFLGQRSAAAAVEQDSLDTRVYRLLVDEMPGQLVTRLRIDVSGGVREVLFGPLLPDGYVPLRLDSRLPARFEADGRLRVQLRPGRWQLNLRARAPGVVDSLSVPVGGENLPDSEVLSYSAADRLRVTAAEGLSPIDPARADVPVEWRQLPAFRLFEGEVLDIVERSRGIVDVSNTLTLYRQMWADFDGRGLTVRDQISGEMRTEWRLDMQQPYELQSAEVDGQQLLVTDGDTDGKRGVEIRQPSLRLETLARTADRDALPISGWDTRFASVQTTLNLPPGQRLLAAPGVDRATGSWLDRWQLLDIFLLLVITASAWKLLGRGPGVVAFLALFLSYHESGAPSWLWLNLLATVALLRVAPAGRLKSMLRGYFYLGLLTLVLVLVPFAAEQLRTAVYPQLDRGLYTTAASSAPTSADMPVAVEAEPRTPEVASFAAGRQEAREWVADEMEELVVTGSRILRPDASVSSVPMKVFSLADANALLQAGPGVPGWRWNQYQLRWSGPVDAGQTHRLIVAPTWLMSLWRVAAVLLLAALAASILAEAFNRRWRLPGGSSPGASSTAAAVVLLTVSGALLAPSSVEAELPDRALLDELRKRLTEPLACEPRCADVVAARVSVEPDTLVIDLDIHASADVGVPVPGQGNGWMPALIGLNGERLDAAVRDGGLLFVAVPRGQHRLRLAGPLPARAGVEIVFPLVPRAVEVSANGWTYTGVSDRRLLSGSLTLERVREASERADETVWESSQFPPFVRITRRLDFAVDWSVHTTVERVAPASGAIELDVPLLSGESVLAEDLEIADGKVTVSMASGQDARSWSSTLEQVSTLVLTAADGREAEEIWRIGLGSIWHLDFSGVPENVSNQQVPNARVAEFNPRPGETLTITSRLPAASPGATLAIDAVQMNTSVGRRLAETNLSFRYRATRGDQHVIRLPEGAELTAVTIDDRTEPLRAVDGALTLPILPGQHQVYLSFSEARISGLVAHSPDVDLGTAASNVSLSLSPERNRWLLLTRGPELGPAVLYWSELLVLVGLALLLGRISFTPLKTRHWLLLALGFSTFNWPVLGLVVAWLLATGARERWLSEQSTEQSPQLEGMRYNALQIAFATFSVVALMAIVVSLPIGLLGQPDMHVVGNGSRASILNWFADRTSDALPSASFVSLPMWTYKALILFWALWLSFALLRWLPWVWKVFARDGLWRSRKQVAES